MEGAAAQRIPEHGVVFQAADGGAWWHAVVSGRLPDSAFLLSLGGRHYAMCLVAVDDVAHKTDFQHPWAMDGGDAGACGYPVGGQYESGLLGIRHQTARLFLCANPWRNIRYCLDMGIP